MKKLLALSTIAALLLFSGCGEEPTVDDNKPVEQVKKDDSSNTLEDTSSPEDTSAAGSNENNVAALNMEEVQKMTVTIHFSYDSFKVEPEYEEKIKSNAEFTSREDAAGYKLKLEGNCDEFGSDEYNYALGLKRAKAVKDAMIAEGIDSSRITLFSYGESNPVCTDKTDACWGQNRRVDFKLLPQ